MDSFVNQILCCDCVAGMKKLPDESVDLGLTSPPFDDLRRYGGQPFTDEVFREAALEQYRILRPGRIFCWDVQDRTEKWQSNGDQFSTGSVLSRNRLSMARHHPHRLQRGPSAMQGALCQRRPVLLRFRQGKTEVRQHSA